MKLYYDKRLSDPTYYVQLGYRDENGKSTTKNIEKIGKHSELLNICDDPLSYAKEYVASINDKGKIKRIELLIDLNEKLKKCDDNTSKTTILNIGYFILSTIYKDLKIDSLFNEVKKDNKFTYDADTINRFLIFDRILNPSSKLQTYNHLSNYFEEPSFDYQHIMRFLDFLYEHYDEYISHLYNASNNIIKRDTSICYYDCTNYYFEIEEDDEDYIDEVTGEVIKGLRKYGISKEHRPNPIVQMGLFMDKDGIPLSMCITSGNDNEQLTTIPLEEKLIRMTKGKKFIYCADAGLGSNDIRKFNDMGGRAFIITQSIKKLENKEKEAVFNDFDYKLLSDNSPVSLEMMKTFDRKDSDNLSLYKDKAYKVIYSEKSIDIGLTKEVTLKNGKVISRKDKATLKQRIIITYSRKQAEYQKAIRERQIERAKSLLKNSKDPEDIKKGPSDIRRFLKLKDKKNYEYIIDEERIKEEAKYDGFYALATNLEDDVKDIINISANRYKIEECFRIMKTDFEGRPVYHHLKEHIIAHFTICFTALLIYRLLEVKLNKADYHFTTREIIDTLKNMNITKLNDLVSKSLYTNSRALEAMMDIYPLDLNYSYYLNNDLNKKLKKIK